MAGLQLRGGLGVTAALPGSATGGTIGGLAYGHDVQVPNEQVQPATAGMGSIAVTAVAAGILAWLWWTLPR